MQRLKHSKALSARSLEVLILTAGRTSEVLKAQWGEIDLDGRLWIVPAERMKDKRVKLSDVTVHGFRSGFRDWVGDETERAYRRGDALERRRDLMQAWADYCRP
jgi:integrase